MATLTAVYLHSDKLFFRTHHLDAFSLFLIHVAPLVFQVDTSPLVMEIILGEDFLPPPTIFIDSLPKKLLLFTSELLANSPLPRRRAMCGRLQNRFSLPYIT